MLKLVISGLFFCLLFYLYKTRDRAAEKKLKRKLARVKTYEEITCVKEYKKHVKNYSLTKQDNRMKIEERFLNSPHVKEKMRYLLITPTDETLENLPVLILFHGIRDYSEDWITRGHLLENYLELIDKKIIKPMIFVVVDSGFDRQSWYSNFYKDKDHKYENYITDTLYNEVKKISPNGKIGIAGFSMGGYAALKIGLKYIEKFDVIGSFSGAVSIIRMSLNRRVLRLMRYLYIPRFLFKKNQDKINFLRIFSPWGWRILKQDPYTIIKRMDPSKFIGKYIYISVGEEDKEPYLMLQQWTDIVGRLKRYKVDFKGYIYKNEYHTWEYISKDIGTFLRYFSDKVN